MKAKSKKLRILAVAVVCVAAVAVWLLIGGGGRQSPPRPEGSADGDATARVADVLVVNIIERHTDAFPQVLADLTPEPSEPPFAIEGGQIRYLDSIAKETDAAKLETHDLVLGTPGVPLADCKLLVIYSLDYAGKGRVADEHRYYAFAKLPAMIAMPGGFEGESLDYDLETAEGAFPFAAMEVRLLPTAGQVQIEGAENEKLTVSFADRSQPLAAGEATDLAQAKRTITVTERAITARPFRPAEGPSMEVAPRVDHGPISFATTLSALYLGKFSTASSLSEAEGDLP